MKNEETYRLLVDIDTPQSGPRLDAGELVTIFREEPDWNGWVMVDSVETHWDVGNGIDEPTENITTAYVHRSNLELISE